MTERKEIKNVKELVITGRKEYVRVKEATEVFSMGKHFVRSLAEEAGAVRKIKGVILINARVLSEYIELMYAEN